MMPGWVARELGVTEYAGVCGKCVRPMARSHKNLPPGTLRHHGRGLCARCHQQALAAERRPKLRDDGYIDELAVEIAVSGARRVQLTHAERQLAVEILTARGVPASTIAERIGIAKETVHRIRSKSRAVA